MATFVFIAFSHIVSAAYLGLGGDNDNPHLVRHADVYAHILGFAGAKDFTAYDSMLGGKRVDDIPIYQYLIASAARWIGGDPLVVTRFFNLACWLLAAFTGYRLCRGAGRGGETAGLAFVGLFSVSPLILRYYSMPLPDTMAAALALAGIVVLHYQRGQGWRGALLALPLLLVATIIKSPTVFPFVLFYAVYAAITHPRARDIATVHVPLAALLVVLLAAALFAEQLRTILIDKPSVLRLYRFGAWELRVAADFWQTFADWVHAAGPFAFGYVYVIVVAAALAARPDKPHIAFTAAAVIAVVGGWLVVATKHYYFDYYRIPATVILYISFAVSSSRLLSAIGNQLPARARRPSAAVALAAVIPLAAAYAIAQKPQVAKARAGLWRGLEHALRNEEGFFLYVRQSRDDIHGPGPGGLVSMKFRYVWRGDFEADCERYLAAHAAVISRGDSACLARNKPQAHYYIEDGDIVFYLNKGEFVPPRVAAAQDGPLLAGYDIDLLSAAAEADRQWTVNGPGEFTYDIEQADGAPTLKVTAKQDMPWLAVFIHRRALDAGRRYHRLEVEAVADDAGLGGLSLSVNSWDYAGDNPVLHDVRTIPLRGDGRGRQSMPFDFNDADAGRDYLDVAAKDIKAGQSFTLHTLRVYSSNWSR